MISVENVCDSDRVDVGVVEFDTEAEYVADGDVLFESEIVTVSEFDGEGLVSEGRDRVSEKLWEAVTSAVAVCVGVRNE